MFEDFILKLKENLKHPLPGKELQLEMAPALRNAGKKYYEPNEHTRQGSVLILLYPDEDQIYFPLIKRPEYSGVHSGQMALPGGKQEQEDRDIYHTAIRETEEEIGADGSNITIIGELSELFIFASNFQVLPVVAFQNNRSSFIPDQKEVEKVVETNIKDLLNPQKRKEKMIRVSGGFEINSPYFDIQNQVVWGATAMMLNEFSSIIARTLKQ